MNSSVRPVTAIAFVGFVIAFTIADMLPSCRVFNRDLDDNYAHYEHGWPLTYMVRQAHDPDYPIGNSGIHEPWPFYGNPPLLEFRLTDLMINVFVAVFLIALATRCVYSWEGHVVARLQFNSRQMAAMVAFLSVFLAIDRMTGGNVVFLTQFYWPVIAGFLVILSIPLSVFSLAQMGRTFYWSRVKSPTE